MIKVVENNIDQIEAVCKKMQLKNLYLFGSAAREKDFSEKSDIDFLFSFLVDENGISVSRYDYFDVMFRLQEITGKKVDLVYESKITNPYFLEKINAEKVKLYEH